MYSLFGAATNIVFFTPSLKSRKSESTLKKFHPVLDHINSFKKGDFAATAGRINYTYKEGSKKEKRIESAWRLPYLF